MEWTNIVYKSVSRIERDLYNIGETGISYLSNPLNELQNFHFLSLRSKIRYFTYIKFEI